MLSPVDFSGYFPLASRFLRFALTAIAVLLFSFQSSVGFCQAKLGADGSSAMNSSDLPSASVMINGKAVSLDLIARTAKDTDEVPGTGLSKKDVIGTL